MNTGSQSQPSQGQSGGSQPHAQPQNYLFKPENIRQLPPQFSQQEKEKWEQGLRELYSRVENNPPDHPAHVEARRKIVEFSKNLTMKVQVYRAQQAQQRAQQAAAAAAAANNANNKPQQNPADQQKPEQRPQPQEGQNNTANTSHVQPQQTGAPGPKPIPDRILNHVNTFPWTYPPNISQGTPEGAKWLAEIKSRYAKGLMAMETSNRAVKQIEEWTTKTRAERTTTQDEEREFAKKDHEARAQYANAKRYVEELRDQQKRAQTGGAQTNLAQTAGAPRPSDNNTQHPPGNSNGGNANQTAARPQMNTQQTSNPAVNTQAVNAAIEQARNQQMGGSRPPVPQGGQISQPPQMPTQPAPTAPAPQNLPQASSAPGQNIKSEAGVPMQMHPTATQALAGIANHFKPGQTNSPQSAAPPPTNPLQGINPASPKALTHQAALQTAAQNYSTGQMSITPTVMGHSHTHPNSVQRETPNSNSQKLPIPKHLPERATQPPQPVQMSQSRPTFTGGPSGSGTGVIGQPVLPKPPGYVLDGEGDRVLSRKKLDELVKQVTGGGESISGGGLTAEVEESVLTVADNFVDQVLQAACKNAKERGSNILEIRDIQLTLERGYNIRIPGYASDEIRTVRKIAPSSGWINKMSAVQAAKVTGGKSAD